MPTAKDLAASRSEKKATGIYIARGDETLGPYNPAEAAALVVGGYLHADDHAARNGDSAWVPLAEFLPPPSKSLKPERPAAPPRWRRLAVVFLLLAAVPFLVAGGVKWFEAHRAPRLPLAGSPSPTPVPSATLAPTPVAVVPPVAEAPTPPPTPVPDGPLRGSLSLVAPDGRSVSAEGVRVRAYPLEVLETALAPTVAAAQVARARLDPQVDTAAAELATRVAEEQTALQAWQGADANDPLRSSLRFAYNGAKTAARTAAGNHRFLLEERAAAAGGEVFFRALPEPTVAMAADDAGNFTLDLPLDDRPYVVAADAPRPAGEDRARRWLVRLTPAQRSGHETLRLDDGNSLSSASDDSLVHAAD